MHSQWIKAALIYPLVYYYSNLPNEASIDKMLLHFVPAKKKGSWRTDRLLMKFFLDPRKDWVGNISFRAYVGMLSHPYDALEYITSALEIKIARGDEVANEILECCKQLSASFPDHRIAYAVSLAEGQPVATSETLKSLQKNFGDKLNDQLLLLNRVLQVNESPPQNMSASSPLMEALIRTRWSRYPVPSDFEELQSFAQRYAVLTAGLVIDTVATGLYLFERERPSDERLHLIRSIILLKGATEFIWLSPGGRNLLESGAITTSSRYSSLTTALDELSEQPIADHDRTWIMRANWIAAKLQHAGKYEEWAQFAQATFPVWVHPRYLSGLD
nr:hypothetical protein [Sphingomonas melonis]